MTAQKCIFCGGKADLLCDSRIGWERKRGEMAKDYPLGVIEGPGYTVPMRYRKIHTCDAAVCSACATPDGVMFVRMRHASFADSIDYCPGHGRGTLRHEITGLQAHAFRARWEAQVRSDRKRKEPSNPQLGLFTGLLT